MNWPASQCNGPQYTHSRPSDFQQSLDSFPGDTATAGMNSQSGLRQNRPKLKNTSLEYRLVIRASSPLLILSRTSRWRDVRGRGTSSMLLTQNHFGVGMQTMGSQCIHTHAVVGSWTAYALHHVHTIPTLPAGCAVVLWTPEVATLFGHLSQRCCLSTAAKA